MPESNTQINSRPKGRRQPFLGEVEINEQATFEVDHDRIRRAMRIILGDARFIDGSLSIAIVDDQTIRKINRQFLNHDHETDVLSFLLELDKQHSSIEGEIVASYQTAWRVCGEFGWDADDELLLYIVHGCLHLAGYDDETAEQQAEMRRLELHYLTQLGVTPSQTLGQASAQPEQENAT